MSRPTRSQSQHPVLVLVMCGIVASAACGGARGALKKPRRHKVTATATAPTMPLTGLAATQPSLVTRPALSVKIDNAPDARPQSGLDRADVVYEEVVEGGITRFLAVFQSQDAPTVGPVRSVRQTDADLLAPLGGLFGYSGGIPPFVADVDATGVADLSADKDGPAYYRVLDRPSPDNLYTSTEALRAGTPFGAPGPPRLFQYAPAGRGFDASGAKSTASVTIAMSPETSASWQWSPAGGDWIRSTNGSLQTEPSSGAPLGFTNVIVMLVPYHDTGYVDPSGAPVPDADIVGSGTAYVLSRGMMARATWAKPAPASVTTYTDSKGAPIWLQPGTTWVMLAPIGAAVGPG